MFAIFREEKLITACMMAFLGGSILLRVFLGWIYLNMIREADNMATTDNKLLRKCKTRFANCYEMNNGVSNIPIFVDRFLNRLAFGHLSFETIYHMSGQAMLLSVVCAGIGICKAIMDGKMLGEILPYYIVSFFGLYLYFSISAIVDVKGKKRVLKVNLVDYLENHLSARIHVTEKDLEMLYGNDGYVNHAKRKKALLSDTGKRTVELMPVGERAVSGLPVGSMSAEGRKWSEAGKSYLSEYSENSAGVSGEELEALLREFLG